jgi:dUTPase
MQTMKDTSCARLQMIHMRDKTLSLEAGKGMVQGIFVSFGITEDDEADGVRTGGFGSTSKE